MINSEKHFLFHILVIATLMLGGCSKKPASDFGLEESAFRYRTAKFEDPSVLAKAGDVTVTRSQILDKSVVLQDLEKRTVDAWLGLAYLHVLRTRDTARAGDKVEFLAFKTKTPLAEILAPFGRRPAADLAVSFAPGARDGEVVARFRGKEITRRDIGESHFRLQSLKRRSFEEVARQLNSQLARMLAHRAAEKAGKSLQDFVNDEVLRGGVSVGDDEVRTYAKSIGLSEAEVTEDIGARFRDLLKSRKEQEALERYAAAEWIGGPIEVSFGPPTIDIALSRDWTPIEGYVDAPVSVIALSGVTCLDCVPFVGAMANAMKKYDGHLQLNWIHAFDPADGVAQLVAEGALCAESLGRGKSFDFIATFARPTGEIDESAFYQWADRKGLDESEFRSCLVERKQRALVEEHLKYADATGVVANPTVWVDGEVIEGVVAADRFESLIRTKIQERNSSAIAAWWRRTKGLLGL